MWDQARLQQLIDQGIEESLTLEYKAAAALEKTTQRKDEITKDVSAMANAAGGTLIYGISECQEYDKRHLPYALDPVDRTEFPKEWLEQVIGNIRPRIDGIVIYPVPLDTALNHVIYVVEIPQSDTAHQANSRKYYKRHNFESVPMDDYEIRDIMNRSRHPVIELSFEIEAYTIGRSDYMGNGVTYRHRYILHVRARNIGRVYAQYINSFIQIPEFLLPPDDYQQRNLIEDDGLIYAEFYEDNTVRDVVDVEMIGTTPMQKFGPARFDPILPSLSLVWQIELSDDFDQINKEDMVLKWRVHADNAPPNRGIIPVLRIPIVDRRMKTR